MMAATDAERAEFLRRHKPQLDPIDDLYYRALIDTAIYKNLKKMLDAPMLIQFDDDTHTDYRVLHISGEKDEWTDLLDKMKANAEASREAYRKALMEQAARVK